MDNAGPVSTSTHKSSQRKFFQWAVKWFYTDQTENINMKPDLPELLCLLQAIGFQLREFEKREDTISESRSKSDSLKVIMECSSSKMRAVMELVDITCQCPNQDDARDASFWSVSGSGPIGSMENMNKVMETGSNLLPSVSKDVTNVVRDVTQYLFKLLKNVPDVNQNTDLNFNLSALEGSVKSSCDTKVALLGRRHTQPDFNTGRCRSLDALMKKDENSSDAPSAALPLPPMDVLVLRNQPTAVSLREQQQQSWIKQCPQFETPNNDRMSSSPVASAAILPVLRRQKTFDMDVGSIVEGEPRPSPPRISSSPVPIPQLCMSLGQISLQSDVKDVPLIEMLLNAKNNLELALKMLINSPSASIVTLDDGFVKPVRLDNFSSKSSPGNISQSESSCSLPVNPVTKNSNLQRSVRRNVASSFQKSSDGLRSSGNNKSMSTNRSLPQRKSTASRSTLSKPQPPKIDTTRPGTSGVSSGSSISRPIITARRRVSPDPKNSSSLIQRPSSSSNTSSISKSSLQTFSKLQQNVASPAKILPTATANKFGFVKKKL